MRRELRFLVALWQANLQGAMEYRVAFWTQILGMMLNNAIYFTFWLLFFDRFKEVGGWTVRELMLVFGVAAGSFGLGVYLFGNVLALSEVIAGGRLDYYLALPRPVLLHVLASRSMPSGLGDFVYGLISFGFSGYSSPDAIARFGFGLAVSVTIFVSFLICVHSLAFWLGDASMLSRQALNGMVTFALYPLSLFDNTAKLVLFTALPAALMGALPAEFVRGFSWTGLLQLGAGAAFFLALALWVFGRGLRRYESGSAVQVQV